MKLSKTAFAAFLAATQAQRMDNMMDAAGSSEAMAAGMDMMNNHDGTMNHNGTNMHDPAHDMTTTMHGSDMGDHDMHWQGLQNSAIGPISDYFFY